MTDSSNCQTKVRRTEALYRFGAALDPRDDFERNLYREWHARDASRATRTIYGRSPHLRGLTPSELRQLAEADVQAQAECAAKPPEPIEKPPPQLEVEQELEAGF